MLAFLTIAAWRVMRFIQHDYLTENLREKFYFLFSPPNWYTIADDADVLVQGEGEGQWEIHRKVFGRTWVRPFDVQYDLEGTPFFYAESQSKLGYLVHCMYCFSIWVAAATVAIYYGIVSGTAVIDQFVYWLVIASGIVAIEKLHDRL